MQDIKMKGEVDRHAHSFSSPLSVFPQLNQIKKTVVAGCFAVAVFTIWKQHVVSTEHVLLGAGLYTEAFSSVFFNLSLPLSLL